MSGGLLMALILVLNCCYTDIQQNFVLTSIIIEVGIQTTDQGNFCKDTKDENATASKCD